MKICHVISAFQRYDTRIFWKQCRSLVNAGHDVTLIANDNGIDEILDGVKIVSSGFKYDNRFQRILLSRKVSFKKALEVNADIYQIHDPELIPIGLKLLKKGKRVIYDSHEDFPRQILEKHWIPKFLRFFLSFLAEFYLKRTLYKFNAVLAVTPHIVDELRKIGANAYLITNYPRIESFNSPGLDLNGYLNKPNNLIYSGTIYPTSQQELILEALNNFDDVSYTIVGTIMKEKDLLRFKSFTSWRKVKFIDFVPKNELVKIYSEATIAMCVFQYSPNLGYKIGTLGSNKLFEYMQCGIPVICSDFKLWKEMIIDKYKCGICVNPYNVEEIINAINYLKTNKKEAFEMGSNAKRAVSEEFNWESQEKEYFKIINILNEN